MGPEMVTNWGVMGVTATVDVLRECARGLSKSFNFLSLSVDEVWEVPESRFCFSGFFSERLLEL